MYVEGVGLFVGVFVGLLGINVGIGVNVLVLVFRVVFFKWGSVFKNFFWFLVIWVNGFVFGLKWFGFDVDMSFLVWWFFGGILVMVGVVVVNCLEVKKVYVVVFVEYEKVFMCFCCGMFYKFFED